MSDEHGHEASGRKPNRLINEQSPYLRQHAHNPVDWYPWGDEALARARAENKPMLLSIGYSACHWCHVMERESFENEQIAQLMNENFVSIKVDREERPDLDQIYMDAVQLLTGRGGWPLTVFLTPEGEPFYGGTYFPPEDRQGMPGFPRVLAAIANAFRTQPADIRQNVERLGKGLSGLADFEPDGGELKPDMAENGARALAEHYDRINGGMGHAPKFPNSFVFSLFLRMHQATGDLEFGHMVRETLTKMAKGGIYDQLGGGFHRYSVDDRWLVPHFEKMLYDNALLARLYLDAGRALGEPEFLTVAREILDYVLREMTSPEGGFYSTQDADSEGEEGKFFVWTPAEARAVLGDELGAIAERYFDISAEGNFEGANILHRTISADEAARLFKKSPEEMERAIGEIRRLPVRGARAAGQAGARRKNSGRVERDDDRRAGRGISGARRRALLESGRARRGIRDGAAVGRPRAQAFVQGRRRALQRLPGGLRAVRRQPDRSLRSLARHALSRFGAHDGRRNSGAVPRRGEGRLLFSPRPTMNG